MSVVQNEDQQLLQKISSKMAVSTFLAGFNFTVLTMILTLLADREKLKGNKLQVFSMIIDTASLLEISSVLFFLATALFVTAIYSFDQLLMPRAFWTTKNQPNKLQEKLRKKISDPEFPATDNRIYQYMVLVWSAMFIPAVLFSSIGLFSLFYALVNRLAFFAIIFFAAIVLGYYHLLKPRLGVD